MPSVVEQSEANLHQHIETCVLNSIGLQQAPRETTFKPSPKKATWSLAKGEQDEFD